MEEEIEVDYEEHVSPPKQKEVEEETEDVYGDLFDDSGERGTLLKAKHAALEEHSKRLEAQLEQSKQELSTCQQERNGALEENKILIRNISCIFRTAQEEIKRKDEALKEKDTIIEQWNLFYANSAGQAISANTVPPAS